jgi:Cu-Zn family superoxide dismutase
MRYWFLVGVVLLVLPTAALAGGIAIAELYNSDGQLVGLASFTEGHDGVRVAVNLFNMPPGTHALHIHGAASCERPDFKSAMGHFNPHGRKHGLKSPDGPHAGDLLNIVIAPDGTGAAIATAPLVTLGDGDNSLFRDGGTALMIHQGPDDYVSDPAGAAGPRIACGVIRALK